MRMALLWAITIPLQWLCAPFWTLIAILPTALQLAAAVAMLSLAYLAAKKVLLRAQPSNARANKTAIIPSVLKVLPLHNGSTGWTLDGIHQLRVFQRHALDSQTYLASHVLIDMNAKSALEVALECADTPNWMHGAAGAVSSVQPVTAADPSSGGVKSSDVIAVTFSSRHEGTLAGMWRRAIKLTLVYVPQLEKFVSAPLDFHIIQFERWSMLVLTSVQSQEVARKEVSSQLRSLQEHILLRRHKVLSSRLPLPMVTLQQRHAPKRPKTKKVQGGGANKDPPPSQPPPSQSASRVQGAPPKRTQKAAPPTSLLRSDSPADSAHLALVDKVCRDMLAMASATEMDGWVSEGMVNNVSVMRKPPGPGEPPLTCIKGTGSCRPPPEFVMVVLTDNQYAQQLDDMLKELRIVHEIIPKTVGLLHLQYKGVWPTTGRDFAMVNFQGRVDDRTIIQGGTSIVDSRVPEDKAYVRGDCLVGGYVIKSVEGDPSASQVTYVGKLDLKGNIPAFVVNKAMASQPQCVNRLRGVVEPLYARAKRDPQLMKRLTDNVKIADLYTPGLSAGSEDCALMGDVEDGDGVVGVATDGGGHTHNKSMGAEVGGEEEEQRAFTPPNLSSSEDGEEGRVSVGGARNHKGKYKQLPQYIADDYEGSVPETFVEESITYPSKRWEEGGAVSKEEGGAVSKEEGGAVSKEEGGAVSKEEGGAVSKEEGGAVSKEEGGAVSKEEGGAVSKEEESASGMIDYRTLGNQIAARVIEETFHVSGLDPLDATTFGAQSGGWEYIGMEKGVCILQKKPADSSHYCFMGKAVVPLQADYVYSSLKNPQLRHAYDTMLKELHIVKAIDNGLYILHMHHETTQCFLKQSRDFCLLVAERSELNKNLLVGSSVEVPECPPNPSITRGKVFYSGWVVEPRTLKTGIIATEITYLLQVDFSGPIPAYILNIISQRQPLAVAYLRDYLMSHPSSV
eukprot:Em0016g70a